jgi:Txe/YoeB family toxin of toxin-antitoxin system
LNYKIVYTKQAAKDSEKIKTSPLYEKAKAYIEIIRKDPYKIPPPYEKLRGDLNGAYSRRLNIQHRLVYEVLEPERAIKIISMWGHYE